MQCTSKSRAVLLLKIFERSPGQHSPAPKPYQNPTRTTVVLGFSRPVSIQMKNGKVGVFHFTFPQVTTKNKEATQRRAGIVEVGQNNVYYLYSEVIVRADDLSCF